MMYSKRMASIVLFVKEHGTDIDAACGQLRGSKTNEKRKGQKTTT